MKKGLMLAVLAMLSWMGVSAQEIDLNPCDPNANAATKELYRYLREDVWGKKVLSGAQALWDYNLTEAEKFNSYSGKYPKVNVFDFQHVDASYVDYTQPVAKNWKAQGGIVGFMWHWSIAATPFSTKVIGKTGFYSAKGSGAVSHFRPAYATVKGTLENKVLDADLDKIAKLLLQYQNEGLSVIWRPLHEAAGNSGNSGLGDGAWFWWGVDGPDALRRLWVYIQNYLYDRGVHNLIYVWTSQLNDTKWYPGDKYVDLVARDNYDKDNHGSKKSDFQRLRDLYPNKMAMLAECGSMPSPESMSADNALWLMVAPWCGDDMVPAQNDEAFIRSFMNHPLIITR